MAQTRIAGRWRTKTRELSQTTRLSASLLSSLIRAGNGRSTCIVCWHKFFPACKNPRQPTVVFLSDYLKLKNKYSSAKIQWETWSIFLACEWAPVVALSCIRLFYGFQEPYLFLEAMHSHAPSHAKHQPRNVSI